MGKQVTELDTLPSFTDASLLPVHNGAGLKKGTLTQLSNFLGTKFSNPNLLINPDFKINQRGETEYAYQASGATQYTVDRFGVAFLNVKTASDGLILNANGTNADGGYFSQTLEEEVEGDTILSFKASAVVGTITFYNLNSKNSTNSGNTVTVTSDGIYKVNGNNTKLVMAHLTKESSCKIEWMKLEQGSIATPFIAPNQAEELVKCKRFYNRISITETFYAATVGMAYRFSYVVQSMRIKPTLLYKAVYDYGISQEEANAKDDVATTVVVSAKAGKTGDCSIEGIITLNAEIY